MAVRKPCRSRGCKSSPRCEHPWWLDVMHNRERYRMPVDDFALARGATAPVTSKQEAEKVWEPKFIAEIVSGKDPRVPIERETKFDRPATVADLSPFGDRAYRHLIEHWSVWEQLAGPTAKRWLLPFAAENSNDPAQARAVIDDQARLTGPDGAMLAAQAAARVEQLSALKARAATLGP